MKRFSKTLVSISTIFIFFIMAIASSSTKNISNTVQGGQIPSAFNEFKDTLLVIRRPEYWGYDHYLEKNFKEIYTGPYKIIKEKELAKYELSIYKYYFDYHLRFQTKVYINQDPMGPTRPSNTSVSSLNFILVDRQNGKTYSTESSGEYSKLMKKYLKSLEEARLNN
jgi:hypothetical protein